MCTDSVDAQHPVQCARSCVRAHLALVPTVTTRELYTVPSPDFIYSSLLRSFIARICISELCKSTSGQVFSWCRFRIVPLVFDGSSTYTQLRML